MKLHFFASQTASKELENCIARYGQAQLDVADAVVVLGGDGTLLDCLQNAPCHGHQPPVIGLNCGTVGFLLNSYEISDLPARLAAAQSIELLPLRMAATSKSGEITGHLAWNEVSVHRSTRQAARLRILVDDVERLPSLVCDGCLVATPAGSTAYNLSAHGPILPLQSDTLALTPISVFRPRRWRGAILPRTAHTRFEVLEGEKRRVAAVAGHKEVSDVTAVDVSLAPECARTVLFDPGQSLEERIMREQFEY